MIPYILAENNEGIYIIPKKDIKKRKVAKKLLGGKEHETEIVNIIIENSGDGTVVHAGAYIGDMIPAISKNVKRLFAFEPNREAFNCAMCVKYLNNCDNTSIYNIALSQNEEGGFLDVDQFKLTRFKHNVDSVKIDSIFNENLCSVIHLDVELHEIPALKGAINTIKRDRPVLIIEDLYSTLNKDLWFKTNVLNNYKEIKKIGVNRVYKCAK